MRGRFSISALMAVLVLAAHGFAQAAEKRVALVVGNANYRHIGTLANPGNDAQAIAARLMQLSFEVVIRENVTRAQIGPAIAEFVGKLGPDSAALFYYAGHGIQVDGRNYLIPVDGVLDAEAAVPFVGVDISQISERMDKTRARIKLIVLDACRNNPFERRLRGTGAGQGLAPMDAARGSFIAFATAPGSVAADGEDANSVYTSALLEALSRPGLSVEEVFKRTRTTVVEWTRGAQTPWEQSSLVGSFVFNLADAAIVPGRDDREGLFWRSINESKNVDDYEDYLSRFPNGQFVGVAKRRIEGLKTSVSRLREQASIPASAHPLSALVSRSDRKFTGFVQCNAELVDRKYVAAATLDGGSLRIAFDNKSEVKIEANGDAWNAAYMNVPEFRQALPQAQLNANPPILVRVESNQITIKSGGGTTSCNGLLALAK